MKCDQTMKNFLHNRRAVLNVVMGAILAVVIAAILIMIAAEITVNVASSMPAVTGSARF